MSLLNSTEKFSKRKKITLALLSIFSVVLIVGLIYLARAIPNATNIDFTSIRKNLSTQGISGKSKPAADMKSLFTKGFEESVEERQASKERDIFVKESRSRIYVETAMNDYYRENYSEAFRRLERAKSYNPGNFLAARLSAQINLELRRYKKAYDDLERARQIPNEDDTVARDLDVLRKIMRYTRSEIDVLQRQVHKNPNDLLASARLEELYEQMKD
jgi:tetratricopeptide (TPR) repeat protein